MAVPFAMPDDDPDAAVDHLFAQLFDLLHLLQIQMRRSRQLSGQIAAPARVRQTSSMMARRPRDEAEATSREGLDPLPDLVNALALLTSATAGVEAEIESSSPAAQAIPTRSRRRRRRRFNSESSCCGDETKSAVVADVPGGQDWTQVGAMPHRKTDGRQAAANEEEETAAAQTQPKSKSCSSESIFSKLVPVPPISGSICTAVICMVGWHFLWAR